MSQKPSNLQLLDPRELVIDQSQIYLFCQKYKEMYYPHNYVLS